jgi:hypothetical protein
VAGRILSEPQDRHRRRLAAFCRLLCRYRDRDPATRQSIDAIARSVAEGKCRGRDRDDPLDCLDELLDLPALSMETA